LLSSWVGIWALSVVVIVSIPKDIIGQWALTIIDKPLHKNETIVNDRYGELIQKFAALEKSNHKVLEKVQSLEELYQISAKHEQQDDVASIGVGGIERTLHFNDTEIDVSLDLKLPEESSIVSGYPLSRGIISSAYGQRNDPFSDKTSWHSGADIAARKGSKIYSTGDGVITFAGERGHYGMLVEVQHKGGYSTRYAHCKEILVSVGDTVHKGQSIALVGSTGRSTGPHVHYEIAMNGKTINPAKLMYR